MQEQDALKLIHKKLNSEQIGWNISTGWVTVKSKKKKYVLNQEEKYLLAVLENVELNNLILFLILYENRTSLYGLIHDDNKTIGYYKFSYFAIFYVFSNHNIVSYHLKSPNNYVNVT